MTRKPLSESVTTDLAELVLQVYGVRLPGANASKRELLDEIEAYFGRHPLPKRVWRGRGPEVRGYKQLFKDLPQHEVSRKALVHLGGDSGFGFMTRGGYYHYLPAFMREAVKLAGRKDKKEIDQATKSYETFVGNTQQFLQLLLVPELGHHSASGLSKRQMNTIAKVFEYIILHEP